MPELGSAVFRIYTDAKDFFKGLQKMESEANAAAARTGKAFSGVDDDVVHLGGSMKGTGNETEQVSRKLQGFGDDLKSTRSEVRRAANEVDQLEHAIEGAGTAMTGTDRKSVTHRKNVRETKKEYQDLHGVLGKFNQSMKGLANMWSILKWPVMITGAGLAAQAISVLSAGVVALTSALGPAAGGLTTLATGFMAVKQAQGVFKLAMMGTSDVTKAWKKELSQTTPAAKQFGNDLAKLAPKVGQLRDVAQKPVLKGLTDGIKAAMPAFPGLKSVIGQTAGVIGHLAKQTGAFVGGNAGDLAKIGHENAVVLGRMGSAGLSVLHALTNILVVSRPLTNWLSKMAQGWARNVGGMTDAARHSGSMTKFFDRSRNTISHLISIIHSMGSAFKNIFAQAYPLGHQLLVMIDRSAKHFADWTASTRGKNSIAKWFAEAKQPLVELGKLAHDITVDFFKLGNQSNFATLIKQVRTQLLPVLVSVIQSTTKAFGPHLVSTITKLARVFGDLGGSSGALSNFVDIIGMMADGLHAILTVTPGMKMATTNALGFIAIWKAASLASAVTGLGALAKGIRDAAAAAKVAQAASAGGGIKGLVGRAGAGAAVTATEKEGPTAFGRLGGMLGSLPPPAMAVAAAVAAIGIAFVVAYKKSETFRNVVNAVWGAVKTAAIAVGGALKTAFGATVGAISTAVGAVKTAVNAVVNEVHKWKLLGAFVKAAWLPISSYIHVALAIIVPLVKTAVHLMLDYWKVGWNLFLLPVRIAWNLIKNAVKTALGVLSGVVKIFEGIFRGDWHRVWEGVKQIFTSQLHGIVGVVKSFISPIGGAVKGIGHAVSDGFSAAFNGAKATVISAVNAIIDVINKIPGVNIGHIGGGGGKAPKVSGTTEAQPHKAGPGHYAQGGKVSTPIAVMGEEAPQHHEWVIATNPQYKKQNLGYWAQAGADLGVPGFASGGVFGKAAGAVAGVAKSVVSGAAKHFLGMLPTVHLPAPLQNLGPFLLGKAKDYIVSKAKDIFTGGGGGKGLGSFDGKSVAKWIIPELRYARKHGWSGPITSGYRSPAAQAALSSPVKAAAGHSEHQGTEYPHGAVDFGGPYDAAGLANKMSFIAATKGFSGKRLKSASGFRDDGHMSGTGHYKGGLLHFAQGGKFGLESLKKLWVQGGGDPRMRTLMAHIALAESGGDPTAANPSGATGLWQILGAMVKGNLQNPLTSAKNAVAKLRTQGLGAWAQSRGVWGKWAGYRDKNLTGKRAAVYAGGSGVGGGPKAPPNTPILKHMSTPNLLTSYGLGQARGQYAETIKDTYGGHAPSPIQAVPDAYAGALTGQQDIYRGRYAHYSKEVVRLKKKMKTQGLGRSGRAKLDEAMKGAADALSSLTGVNDTIAQVNDQFKVDPLQKRLDKENAKLAEGQLSGNVGAQGKAMQDIVDTMQMQYNIAKWVGDPQKIAEAATNLKGAQDQLKSFNDENIPTQLDYANAALSQAQLTSSISDDISALTTLDGIYYQQYQAAVASGDPKKIAEAAANYGQAHQQLVDITPTAIDYGNAALAQAGLTDGIGDDLSALTTLDGLYYQQYQDALATGDPKKIAQAAGDYKSIHDQLTSLTPNELDMANVAAAEATLTDSLDDDLAAATRIQAYYKKQYDDLKQRQANGEVIDPQQLIDAANNLKGANDTVKSMQPQLPSLLTFGDKLPDNIVRGIVQPGTEGKTVVVNQTYTKPPVDIYSHMRSAEFAARSAFG